ncbi:PadR family transcriptional regulator [Desulfosporosinus sp. FKA]|uniref:PadR family transcriptional regulator n=1 Tax=Desulfosporosinus sp. FKA TaxID=1969834 RepID=UPI000B49BA46|nr:PadR family transcriptional regulator [Desulfosporosinus sp. FKA]
MATVNKTKYALLGVLNVMPCSGYDIKKFCDSSISHFWNENYARIYPVLKEMEKEGLVVKETEHTEGRPSKNVYSITEAGKHELAAWLLEPVQSVMGRNELLLKLFFSSEVPLENIIEKLEKEKVKHEKLVADYLQMEAFLKADEQVKNSKDFPLWLATLSCGRYNSEARIKWCQETIRSLTNGFAKEGD